MTRRGYLSQAELAQYADITITDTTEADDQISQAEELIDSYVGVQDKFLKYQIRGKASAGSHTSLSLDPVHANNFQYVDYFSGCIVEIIGGTGIGERKLCTSSTILGVLTTESFTATIDNTSVYKIYQIGKFPRHCDVFGNTNEVPSKYYKSIPEAVKRAVAAEVEFIIQMGPRYFSSDASEKDSENIGNYSYSKRVSGGAAGPTYPLIAPKAKILLKGITQRIGQIIIDQ